jgi:hypothetical protein
MENKEFNLATTITEREPIPKAHTCPPPGTEHNPGCYMGLIYQQGCARHHFTNKGDAWEDKGYLEDDHNTHLLPISTSATAPVRQHVPELALALEVG